MTKIEPSAPVATTDDRPRLAVAAAPGTPLPVASFGLPAINAARFVRPRGPVADGVTEAGGELDDTTGAIDETTGAGVEATTGAALVVGAGLGEIAALGVVLVAAKGGVDLCERCTRAMTTTTAAATTTTLVAAISGFENRCGFAASAGARCVGNVAGSSVGIVVGGVTADRVTSARRRFHCEQRG